MKANLRRAPSIEPELGLHASGFLGGIGMQLIFRGSGLIRNLMLFGEPRTQVNQAAAIAAKWPVLGCRRPLHIALAGRTLYDRGHRAKDLNC